MTSAQTDLTVKIHVYRVLENGTTKSLPGTTGEMRIYLVIPPETHVRAAPPEPGPSRRWT